MPRRMRLYLRERPADTRGFLSFLVDHGFTGVIVESTNAGWIRRHDEIHRAGLKLGVSPGFPHPAPFVDEDGDDEHEEGPGEQRLRLAITEASELGADELHPDAENGYGKAAHAARRQAFAAALEACAWDGDMVVTSYPSFPVRDFVREGVSASVQLYDRYDDQPLTFAKRWVTKWRGLGFGEVRAGVGIYRLVTGADGKERGEPKPLERQRAYLDSFPPGVDADVWTLRSQQKEFRQAAAHFAELRRFAAR